jgi:hypothetical protein
MVVSFAALVWGKKTNDGVGSRTSEPRSVPTSDPGRCEDYAVLRAALPASLATTAEMTIAATA